VQGLFSAISKWNFVNTDIVCCSKIFKVKSVSATINYPRFKPWESTWYYSNSQADGVYTMVSTAIS